MPDFDSLGNTCVVGLQWGDEGKGKVVDALLEHYDAVVRYSGGANAGHTVVVGDARFALHQLPSGIIRPNVASVIAGGTVIDPAVLLGEIAALRERGVAVGDNLHISDRAHVVMPYHRMEDQLAEKRAADADRLGTTARGIGPCYADKMSRRFGVRVCDLYRPDRLRERLAAIVAHKSAYFAAVYEARETPSAARIADEYLQFAEHMRRFVCDTAALVNGMLSGGKRVMFEGAQGSLLDVDHGTYPYVTSSNACTGGAASGAGVPPTAIRSTVGVIKAYSTRVGAGPFPTELKDDLGAEIRERGHEYGTTTGRPRRCGWLDAVAARYAAMICGATHLAVVHLDSVAGMPELNVCVGYQHGGRVLSTFPADAHTLDEVTAVYRTFAGWSENIGQCRSLDELPATARAYLAGVSEIIGVPLSIVSVGPAREQTIYV